MRAVGRRKALIGVVLGACVLVFIQYSQPRTVQEFADVWGANLSRAELTDPALVATLRFDERTRWPQKLPQGFVPEQVLELGKDPGLGIRGLHEQGITGAGVGVAVVDGVLHRDHVEYKKRIHSYHQRLRTTFSERLTQSGNAYHGTMAVSILAGSTTGVAPGANVHYFEADLAKREKIPEIIADVMEFNRTLADDDKIRVISISLGAANLPEWDDAIVAAKEQGILVVQTDWIIGGIGCPTGQDRNDPSQYAIGNAFAHTISFDPQDLLVPTDYRTMAHPKDPAGYGFTARGGLSLGAPYFAGLLALGWEVDPDLPVEDMIPLLRQTGDPFHAGGIIVNPKSFIQAVQKGKRDGDS